MDDVIDFLTERADKITVEAVGLGVLIGLALAVVAWRFLRSTYEMPLAARERGVEAWREVAEAHERRVSQLDNEQARVREQLEANEKAAQSIRKQWESDKFVLTFAAAMFARAERSQAEYSITKSLLLLYQGLRIEERVADAPATVEMYSKLENAWRPIQKACTKLSAAIVTDPQLEIRPLPRDAVEVLLTTPDRDVIGETIERIEPLMRAEFGRLDPVSPEARDVNGDSTTRVSE